MIISTNEVLHPEDLAELGALFDEILASTGWFAGGDGDRTQLASILLRLYGLRQLGREQLTHVALRLYRHPLDPPEDGARDPNCTSRSGSSAAVVPFPPR